MPREQAKTNVGAAQPVRLAITALGGISLVQPDDDLAAIIVGALEYSGEALADGDVLVLAQKIVSKAEGRYAALDAVTPSPRALELAAEVDKDARLVELILSESTGVVRRREGVLVVAHRIGLVLANAGIDASNVEQAADGGEQVLLLPENPDHSADRLRAGLLERTGKTVGIIINDSLGRAWRNGTVGAAIGAAGIGALQDLRGTICSIGRSTSPRSDAPTRSPPPPPSSWARPTRAARWCWCAGSRQWANPETPGNWCARKSRICSVSIMDRTGKGAG